VIAKVEAILRRMADAERLSVVIELLRDVIKLQDAAAEATRAKAEAAGADIFSSTRDGQGNVRKDK
jgi:hypothetical protein